MPPVWGQSAPCSSSYARFTEEWSFCLARGSCRGDEGLSIDVAALVSIDSDARIWAEHILWPLKPRSSPKLPEYPWTTRNPIYVISKPLLTATLSIILFYCFLLGLERRSILLQRLIGTPLVLSFISNLLYYSDYDLCYCLHVWVIHLVRLRDWMSLMSNR